jgi:hypothetical protein
MRKLLFALTLVTPLVLSAQLSYRTEIGGGVGILSYSGDLDAERTNPGLRNQGLGLALNLRKNVHNLAAIRLNLAGGQLKGDDASFTDSNWRPARGFSFNSPLFEGSLLLEAYPFGMFKTTRSASGRQVTDKRRLVAPVASIGIGGVFTRTKTV